MFIKENNEKSQIIKLIKQSRTDNELKEYKPKFKKIMVDGLKIK